MRGHKCPAKFLLLMAGEDDDAGNETPVDEEEAIGTSDVHVLIDNGGRHNFVRPDVVERIRLLIKTTKTLKVYIGSGETLLCENVGLQVTLHMQGLTMEFNLIKELMQQVIQTSLQQKYVWKLMGFNFVIKYKLGLTYQVVDDVSRMCEDEENVTALFMAMNQLMVGFIPDLKCKNESLKELLSLHQKMDRREIPLGFRRENGLFIYRDRYFLGSESKLKVPFLCKLHDTPSAGHSGTKKMLDPGGYLQPHLTTTTSWEDVSMDFITRLPVSKWLMSILVVVVRFSKYEHFGALPTSFNSHKVAEVFMEIVLKHHGFPKTIVSDRDPIFVCGVWEDALVGHSISSRIFKGSSGDELLVERDGLLRQLRQNLLTTKHRMEVKTNRKKREVAFNIGDMVLVKLQPFWYSGSEGRQRKPRGNGCSIFKQPIELITLRTRTLTIQEDRSKDRHDSRLNIISCTKAHKYILKGCQVFLTHISEEKTEEKSEKKRLEDVPIRRDYPKVFHEDLPGFSPTRQPKFQIDLIPSVAPVARPPYRLTPSEKHELASQLQELSRHKDL
ncbi:ty3-gypsy retrotransposon protein [Tanacetum coccineum]